MPNIYRRKKELYFKTKADYHKYDYDNNTSHHKEYPKFSDIPESMFEIMMALIIEFVEEEDCFNVVSWKGIEDIADEIKKIYKFAKVYPKYKEKLEEKYLFGDMYSLDLYNVYCEEKLYALEDQMMFRLINIRQYLWT